MKKSVSPESDPFAKIREALKGVNPAMMEAAIDVAARKARAETVRMMRKRRKLT